MVELGVPHGNPLVPPAEQGRIGLSDSGQVIAGRWRMEPVDAERWLMAMLGLIRYAPHPGVRPGPLHLDRPTGTASREELYKLLARLDAPAPDPDPNLRFFRTTGGAVMVYDREPNEFERRGIVKEISRKEAWGQ